MRRRRGRRGREGGGQGAWEQAPALARPCRPLALGRRHSQGGSRWGVLVSEFLEEALSSTTPTPRSGKVRRRASGSLPAPPWSLLSACAAASPRPCAVRARPRMAAAAGRAGKPRFAGRARTTVGSSAAQRWAHGGSPRRALLWPRSASRGRRPVPPGAGVRGERRCSAGRCGGGGRGRVYPPQRVCRLIFCPQQNRFLLGGRFVWGFFQSWACVRLFFFSFVRWSPGGLQKSCHFTLVWEAAQLPAHPPGTWGKRRLRPGFVQADAEPGGLQTAHGPADTLAARYPYSGMSWKCASQYAWQSLLPKLRCAYPRGK